MAIVDRGTVVSSAGGRVDVLVSDTSACEGCDACGAVRPGEPTVIPGVRDPVGARVGDTVEVETPDAARRGARRLVYAMPVGALLAGYLAGYVVASVLGSDPDGTGAVVAVLSLVLSFAMLRPMGERMMARDTYRPSVRAIIARGPSNGTGTGCRSQ